MILHTSVPFGLQHIDLTVPEAEPILKEVEAIDNLFLKMFQKLPFKFHIWT